MRKKGLIVFWFILITGLFFIGNVKASTINAANCSQSAVQSAINSSTSGDTVKVPAGSCTWSSTLTIDKNINLKGAGVEKTIITYSGGPILDYIGDDTADDSRLSGFSLNGYFNFDGPGNPSTWLRIDHLNVTSDYSGYWATPWGTRGILIDHCEFHYTGSTPMRMFIFNGEGGADPDVWREDSAVGTDRNVFIEDTILDGGTKVMSGNHMAFQVWWAGRVVMRHCTIINFAIDAHDYRDSSQRGARNWEIYDNNWTRTPGIDLEWMNFRAGTGVVYNNRMTESNPRHGIKLMAYSVYGYVSPCCCLESPDYMYNMDGIGRGKFTGTKIPGDSSLFQDCQDREAWGQQLEPAYFWNNTRDGVTIDPSPGSDCGCASECGQSQCETDAIQEGRDYFNYAKPGYAPYTYPHPLTHSGNLTASCSSGADDDGDSVVSNLELTGFISDWKGGTVTIGNLIAAVSEWKNGC